jgi:hypothetical protein
VPSNPEGHLVPHITEHVTQLHHLIDGLRRCVTSLASAHGDTAAIRRIVNDAELIRNAIDRLEIDAAAPELHCRTTAPRLSEEMMIPVPTAEYHFSFWQDVDHEGIGQMGALARNSRTRKRR